MNKTSDAELTAMPVSNPAELSLAEVEAMVGDLTQLQAQLAAADNAMEKRCLALEAALDAIRREHQPQLDALAGKRAILSARYERRLAAVRAWSEAQRPILFAARRSLEFLRGVLGFRRGPLCVALLPGWTEDRALAALAATRWGRRYVRSGKLSLDKRALVRDCAELARDPAAMFAAGLVYQQSDEFFFEPKREINVTPLAARRLLAEHAG